MKRKILDIAALLALVFSLAGFAQGAPTAWAQGTRAVLAAVVPSTVSYQGYVTGGGNPYNGTGYFKFAVVNAAGDTTYWSNDGTSAAGGQPTAAVQLAVSDGMFSVLLGQAPMQPLGADAFSAPERALRIWFSQDGATFTHLEPDRKISSVPFALRAEYAASAANADLLDGFDGSYYQRRANGTCAPGSTVRLVNADGTVVCEAHDAFPGFSLSTLDSQGNVGDSISIAIGVDGLGLISYHDNPTGLKVAHCNDPACTSATITPLDTSGGGWDTAITIGADGLGLISYQGSGYLKVAHCNNLACTSATITQFDSGNVGWSTSIAIGADGLGWIGYRDDDDTAVKLAHCTNLTCTTADIIPVDNAAGSVNWFTALVITPQGYPVLAYGEPNNGELRMVWCEDMNCSGFSSFVVDTLGPGQGVSVSLAIGADGIVLASYYDPVNKNLKMMHCGNSSCSARSISTLDSSGRIGEHTSLTIGADGLGLVSYYDDASDDLKVAHCSNPVCTSATLHTLDSDGNVGEFSAVTLGMDGLGLIAYYDGTNGDLKVAHLSSVFGTPWTRRR